MGKQLNVPLSLQHPLFFHHKTVEVAANRSLMEEPYFLYELQVIEGQPWNERTKGMEELDQIWERIKPELEEIFKSRDPLAKQKMKAVIALLFMSLFWCNGKLVQLHDWKTALQTLAIKPVNAVERVDFILQRPGSYHAFKQAGELIEEQRKQWAKYRSIHKIK